MPLGNDLSTYTPGGAPTIIGDLANLAGSVYATVTGRPVATVQTQIAAQQVPMQSTGGLTMLILLGVVIWLVVRK